MAGVLMAGACGWRRRAELRAAGFEAWVADYKKQAASQGISARAIAAGLDGVTYDPNIIRLDRGQKSFKLSFEQFYARRVSSSLLSRAKQKMSEHAALFSQDRTAIWRAAANYCRDLGAGDEFRVGWSRWEVDPAFAWRRWRLIVGGSDFFQNELDSCAADH